MAELAILGLGAMGSRLAQNLSQAGHAVTVWNRTPDRAALAHMPGARLAASPAEAACGAEFVIAVLRDDEASRRVWCDPRDGALAAMKPGAIAIECSTLSTDWVGALAQQSGRDGIFIVDAPIVGSRPQAEAKQLIFLAGGPGEAVERVRPVLMATGTALHHVGPSGSGMRFKLAVNALFAIQVAALAELLAGLAAQDVALDGVVDVLGQLPVLGAAGKGAAALIVAHRHSPLFPIELVTKDLGYFMQAGGGASLLTSRARELFAAAASAGYGQRNITAIAEWIAAGPAMDEHHELNRR